MHTHLSMALVCLVATGNSPAFSQTVAVTGKTDGKVLVNRGNGFVKVTRGTQLASGDTVFVKRGGQVLLEYANGCTQTVKPGRVQTVDQAGCDVKSRAVGGTASAPLIGGLAVAGLAAAIALGLAQDDGAPGGSGNRHSNPVSR